MNLFQNMQISVNIAYDQHIIRKKINTGKLNVENGARAWVITTFNRIENFHEVIWKYYEKFTFTWFPFYINRLSLKLCEILLFDGGYA